MSEWISVKDRMPTKYPVLICFLEPFFGSFSTEVDVGFYDDPEDYDDKSSAKEWCFWRDERKVLGGWVTHWMPLPAPPKD